jgi:hypothetical protein
MARYDIFVSYARANEERVAPLVELLRRKGYRVFFDQRELVVGYDFKKQLDSSIPASRVLVLCWSKEAAESKYVLSELFRAKGLKRPVLPWLLDSTELPKLVEIQAIKEQELEAVLERLRPRLGMQLRWWQLLQASAVLAVAATGYGGYAWVHRPWMVEGEVRSAANEAPLAGVTVELTTAANEHYMRVTGGDGRFAIALPRRGIVLPEPVPATVDLLFRKDGYKTDHETAVSTSSSYRELLVPND